VIKKGATVVGVTGLVDVQDGTAELGYWVGRPFWGKGYATERVRQTVERAFDELGLTHLFARPLKSNPPSRRVLEKLGFTEGDVEQHELWSEGDPVVRYTLDAADRAP
jgi:RimJ/RimL family protein N-acetyltransferase